MRALMLTLTLLFFFDPAFAEDDCSPTQNLGESLGPAFHQHCTHWCAIFVASDMLTQKLQKEGKLKPGERIHPLSMAGSLFLGLGGDPSSRAARNREFNPAFVLYNIPLNNPDAQLCKETDLGADMGLANELFKKPRAQTSLLRQELTAAEQCQRHDEINRLEREIHKISMASWKKMLAEKCRIRPPSLDPSFPLAPFDLHREDALLNRSTKTDPAGAAKIATQIDASLAKGKIAAILMDIDHFVDPKNNVITKECGPASGPGLHWASVVGRRRDARGVCEYLVRSSWGTSCQGFYKPRKCENGTFWIPRSELTGKVSDVRHLP